MVTVIVMFSVSSNEIFYLQKKSSYIFQEVNFVFPVANLKSYRMAKRKQTKMKRIGNCSNPLIVTVMSKVTRLQTNPKYQGSSCEDVHVNASMFQCELFPCT